MNQKTKNHLQVAVMILVTLIAITAVGWQVLQDQKRSLKKGCINETGLAGGEIVVNCTLYHEKYLDYYAEKERDQNAKE